MRKWTGDDLGMDGESSGRKTVDSSVTYKSMLSLKVVSQFNKAPLLKICIL